MNRTVALSALCAAFIVLGIAAAIGFAVSNPQPSGPEDARDLAIDQALHSHPELSGLRAAGSWETRDLTPPGLVGASKFQYVGEGWTVTVSYPVVQHPRYNVEVQHTGEIDFSWRGYVDQAGDVVELDYSVSQ